MNFGSPSHSPLPTKGAPHCFIEHAVPLLILGFTPSGFLLAPSERLSPALAFLPHVSTFFPLLTLRKLASEQLVSFEPHLGVRVPGWSDHDIEEIFALRVELESYAAGQAARHANPAQVAELRELAGHIEKAAFGGPEPDYVGITELNNRFHGLIVAAAGNRRLVSLVVTLVEIPLVVRTFARFDRQELARSVSHHFDLVEAIAGGNADWAVAVMRAHIHAGRQVMLRTSAGGESSERAIGVTSIADD
jgi:DNA-binding GntR family transcriptional regulator